MSEKAIRYDFPINKEFSKRALISMGLTLGLAALQILIAMQMTGWSAYVLYGLAVVFALFFAASLYAFLTHKQRQPLCMILYPDRVEIHKGLEDQPHITRTPLQDFESLEVYTTTARIPPDKWNFFARKLTGKKLSSDEKEEFKKNGGSIYSDPTRIDHRALEKSRYIHSMIRFTEGRMVIPPLVMHDSGESREFHLTFLRQIGESLGQEV